MEFPTQGYTKLVQFSRLLYAQIYCKAYVLNGNLKSVNRISQDNGTFQIKLYILFLPAKIPLDPQKLSLVADPLSKWGVRLQNSSTYSRKNRGPRLEFINIQPPKRGSTSSNHQLQPPKGVRLQDSSTKVGSILDFINQKGVCLQNSSTKKRSASRFHQPKRNPINPSLNTQ